MSRNTLCLPTFSYNYKNNVCLTNTQKRTKRCHQQWRGESSTKKGESSTTLEEVGKHHRPRRRMDRMQPSLPPSSLSQRRGRKQHHSKGEWCGKQHHRKGQRETTPPKGGCDLPSCELVLRLRSPFLWAEVARLPLLVLPPLLQGGAAFPPPSPWGGGASCPPQCWWRCFPTSLLLGGAAFSPCLRKFMTAHPLHQFNSKNRNSDGNLFEKSNRKLIHKSSRLEHAALDS